LSSAITSGPLNSQYFSRSELAALLLPVACIVSISLLRLSTASLTFQLEKGTGQNICQDIANRKKKRN